MLRRSFLAGSAAALAAPAIVQAQASRVLRFIPQADLAVLDPIWTTAYVTRNHGMLVFDMLYGYDAQFRVQPQMAEGHTVEDDGRTWNITLRPGLLWHDGTPVLARDCTASIARWGKRDSYGMSLMDVTDELSAPDDRTVRFRLKRPFPLLPDALGKPGSAMCAMMPERLAKTDPFTQVTEMVGSGPFRFMADERVSGSRVAYQRFEQYQPRPEPSSFTAGGKRVFFDRVEWTVVPDPGTSAAALQNRETDWWENPAADLVGMLSNTPGLTVEVKDTTGNMGCMRLNELQPPFDNPRIRRALLRGVSQDDYTVASGGDDPKMRRVPAGIFCPGTPMATDAGLDVFAGQRDYDAVRREIEAAGYKGEKVVLMAPTDFPILKAQADVGQEMLAKCGFNVDYQAADWGSVIQRRGKKDPSSQGGWSVFHTFWAGLDQFNPANHTYLRATGETGAPGWPRSEKLESLRDQWLAAPDEAAQKSLARTIQLQALQDVPYVPLGQIFFTTGYRGLADMQDGFVQFWSVKRA